MKRPVFSFRPNLENPDHKRAWKILQAVPEGQKNQYLVKAILQEQDKRYLERIIQETVRKELKYVTVNPDEPVKEADEIPNKVLDFISMLQDE